MDFKGKSILSTQQFDRESLLEIFEEARKMENVIANGDSDLLKGRLMATLFYEPSTRTRFSFETAMQRLGGRVVSNADMTSTSSFTKKETLKDTGKVVSQMVDVIVMRHPTPGSVAELACASDVPVINAGDGTNEHPTQALLDLYTIWKNFGAIQGKVIGMVGDLKNSRVQHSQCSLLKHFDCSFVLASPVGLEMPQAIIDELRASGHEVKVLSRFEELLVESDVVSVSRIQKERFATEEEYAKCCGVFVLGADLLNLMKKDAIILHPLPRVDEIEVAVDRDPRAKYFEQVGNGVAVRMALLARVFR